MAKKKYDTATANARVDAAFARLGIGQGGRPAAPVARPARGGSSTYSVGSRAGKVDRKGLAALNANYEKKLAFDKKKEDAKNDDDSSWWQDVLSAVDLPADFVRQSIGSGTQAVSDIFGGEGDWKDYLQTGVNALSLGTAGGLVAAATDNNDFNKDFSEHKGMGSHLHDALKATGQDKGVLGNEWLDRGLGFAGDVATDPLTYLAPEAKLAGGAKKVAGRFVEAGAKAAEEAGAHAAASGAEHAAVQAAKDAAKSSFEAAAAKVLAKGKSSLTADEKALIGARGGVHVRVPGTGRIGRKLFKTSEELLPLGGADASAAVGRTTRAALDKAVPKSLKGFIAENLSGKDQLLKAALKSGDAEQAIPAFHTLRGKAVEALAQETHGNALTKEWKAITKGHKADDIFRAVEGDPEAVGRVGADKVAEVNSYFAARRQELLDAGVEVGLVDQYVPRQLTGEARDALHANEPVGARSGAFAANPAEAPRTLTPEKFGVQTQAEVRAQAEEWAQSQGLTNLFEQDPDKVMAAYIRSHAKRMSDLRLEAALQEKGVFGKAFTGADKTALDDAIREGTETRSKLDDVVAQRDDLVENQIPLADEEEWQQQATQTMLDKARRGVKNAKVKVSRLDAKVAEHEAEKAALEAGLPPSPEAVLESAHDAARQVLKEKGLTALPDPQGGTLVFAEGGTAGSSEALADIKRATGMDAKYELVGKDVALPTRGGRRVGDVYKVDLTPLPKDRAISAVERANAPLDTPEAVASAVEDTQKRIAELDQKIELAGSKRKTLLEEQKAHETKRAFYLDQAQRYPAGSPEQSVSALQAQAEGLEADLATLRTQYRTQQETVAALSDKADQAAKIVKDGAHKLIGNASTAPPELVEALSQVTKVSTKEGVRDFLKYYDKALNYLKAWQLTSPGFHVRNMMGGMFNNYLAGVEMGSYRAWKKIAAEVDAAEAAGHALTAEQARAKQLMELIGYRKSPLEAGQYGAGEIGLADLGKEPSKLAKRNPLGTQGPIVNTSQKFGRDVEWHLRGSLGWDRLVKGESLESAVADINKYHFDYQDLSQFEKSVVKRVVPFYCMTPAHEVLSERGWLNLDQITKGDRLWTLNADGKGEWEVVDAIFRADDYDGPMVKIKSRDISAVVTPDHRWPTTSHYRQSDRYLGMTKGLRPGDSPGRIQIKETQHLRNSDQLFLAAPSTHDPEPTYTDDFVELVGWTVTEGHYDKRCNAVHIYQSEKANPVYCKEIFALMDRMELTYTTGMCGQNRDVRSFNISAKDPIITELKTVAPTRYLTTEFVVALSADQRTLLRDTLVKADGSMMYENQTFCTNHEGMRDAFVALCALSGIATYTHPQRDNGCYYTTVKHRDRVQVKNLTRESVDYEGTIWCPHTPNNTIYVRHEGTTFWTSNTWTRRNVPLQFQMLVEKPAAYSHYFQAMNELQSGSTPEGVVPQYFSDLFATPIGNQTIQGDRAYAVPDLPLTRTMTEALPTSLDPKENFNKYLSQVTPLLKTPVELYTGKQAFKDIPLSEKWVSPPIIGSVPGLSDVLKASGLLNEKGQIRSKWAYAIEQAMPAYGRIRRLAPTEEKYKNRLLASYLAFAGIPIRTNTPEEKADELKRRSFEKKAAAKKKKSKKSAFSIY